MNAYPDTSFLCALYRSQDNSYRALAFRKSMTEPLHVTRLLLWEFRQSVRFQAFRHRKDPSTGYPLEEAERMIEKISGHMRQGLVQLADCDVQSVLITGERISKLRTVAGGHRSFDLLHVASALVLDAREFLSFDANQISLAAAEGLATPLNA
ncbi:MAG: PIN domain-containing protein [Verrucomicrobiota bacterium]